MSKIVAPPDLTLTQTPTAASLNGYVGKHIKNICGCEFYDDSFNHCAHFAGHALGFAFGYTCKHQTGKGKAGATIRVHELFKLCPEAGAWADRGASSCLVFITASDNVHLKTQVMDN